MSSLVPWLTTWHCPRAFTAVRHAAYAFDTLCSLIRCVSFFFLSFYFVFVFEAAIYANKDVHTTAGPQAAQ